ncbi:MAG: hypothetical protein H6868_09160 [Rhodospirillales bacterium]|nr:hypothetical protein [Rhodospirillales bacterium]
MLEAEDKQFRLNDEGHIFYQADKTNPLPGVKIARVSKGESIVRPAITMDDGAPAGAKERLEAWLPVHVDTVLEALAHLRNEENITGFAKDITGLLHGALGILPRADLENMIAGLDEEGRAALRQRKVRMGPVLVYLPALNKPAAVHLRALLWSLWHDLPLPAPVPADGITSLSLADKADGVVDPALYRAMGYPVYGGRAIRVDMLDRLVVAVYDSADKGTFKARHEMAEWLGCPIADLYAVLEAMGHTKIHDPADEPIVPTDEPASPEEPKAEAQENETEKAPVAVPQVKPELATFRLRKGKAYGGQRPKPSSDRPASPRKKPEGAYRKPKGGKKPERNDREPQERIYKSEPARKPEDSPFAILQQLKAKSGGE